MVKHIIRQGDIIKIDFDPQIGHEQAGYRPALVISNDYAISRHQNVIYVCPITNTNKPYPTHVPLDNRTETTGVVLCEHGKALDLINRECIFVEKCPKDILIGVVNRVKALLNVPTS
jgi:mRNA interferase MazF